MSEILAEYERLRSVAESNRDARRAEVYERYPELEEIDTKLYRGGADNLIRIINDPKNAAKYNEEYRKYCGDLRRRRGEFIEKNGIDADFDKPRYRCALCGDTGFLPSGGRCECYERMLVKERYARSNLKDRLDKETFESFSLDFYSRESDGKHKLSPYENMERIYGHCVDFCDGFDTHAKGLLFYGKPGLGKTFLSCAIARRLMDSGKSVVYMRAPRMFALYEENRFLQEKDEVFADIYECDLLIIDDLGTEAQSKTNLAFLFEVMSERIENGKKIVISTNYSLGELAKMYSSRFTSRVYENFCVYGFYGDDVRILKIKR